MSESKKRKFHPPEFKAKVAVEALGEMKTINQIAQKHGVHPMQVGQWKQVIQVQAKCLFKGKRARQALRRDRTIEHGARLAQKKSCVSLPLDRGSCRSDAETPVRAGWRVAHNGLRHPVGGYLKRRVQTIALLGSDIRAVTPRWH